MLPLQFLVPLAVQVHGATVSGARGEGGARAPSAPETPVLPTAPAGLCPGPPAAGGAATAPSAAAPPSTTRALGDIPEKKQPLWGDGANLVLAVPLTCSIWNSSLDTRVGFSLYQSWSALCTSSWPKKGSYSCVVFAWFVLRMSTDRPRCEATHSEVASHFTVSSEAHIYTSALPTFANGELSLFTSSRLSFHSSLQLGFVLLTHSLISTTWLHSPDFKHVRPTIGREAIWLAWKQKLCIFHQVGKMWVVATTDWCQPIRRPK